MTLSHAIKNISQYRRRYGLSKALKTSIHYGYVTLNKNRLKKVSELIEVNGSKLQVIPNDPFGTSAELLMFRTHEPISTKLVSKLLKKGMTCLDIGSNIGYYVLLENKIIGKEGKVIAIEPSPYNFQCLKKNLEFQNKYSSKFTEILQEMNIFDNEENEETKEENQDDGQNNPSNEDQESENEDQKDQKKEEETETSLDSDYDIDEYKLDEQLIDTDSDLQSNDQIIQKKKINEIIGDGSNCDTSKSKNEILSR